VDSVETFGERQDISVIVLSNPTVLTALKSHSGLACHPD